MEITSSQGNWFGSEEACTLMDLPNYLGPLAAGEDVPSWTIITLLARKMVL